MSRHHPQQWTVNHDVTRAPAEVVDRVRAFPTTQLADSGAPVGVVGPGISPVGTATELCGTAVTLWTKPGDILFVLKAPDLVGPGDVLVIDSGGRGDAAVIGDILGGMVRERGGVGLVVDGMVRDVDGLQALGLPVFARGTHPATGSKDGPGALNVEIQVGGVVVRPGDVVRGDSSGLVVVRPEHAEAVLAATRAVADREAAWTQALASGRSLDDVFGIDELIAQGARSQDPRPLP